MNKELKVFLNYIYLIKTQRNLLKVLEVFQNYYNKVIYFQII